jgi:hypothetical protein
VIRIVETRASPFRSFRDRPTRRRKQEDEQMTRTLLMATAALLAISTGQSQAATIAALVGDNSIALIDADSRTAKGMAAVSGVEGKLLGIDWRPSDGMLYGLFADGTVATIDAMNGKATKIETLKAVPPAGATVTADFNPVADAFRIMGSDGTNLRTKIAGGAVATDKPHVFADDDMHKGAMPMIVAGAYSNAMKGAEKTALYTIEAKNGVLAVQNPPNDGVQKSIGKLGVDVSAGAAFDIVSDGKGGNAAYLAAGGKLYSVDIMSGAAKEWGAITGVDGMIRDIAILPGM